VTPNTWDAADCRRLPRLKRQTLMVLTTKARLKRTLRVGSSSRTVQSAQST